MKPLLTSSLAGLFAAAFVGFVTLTLVPAGCGHTSGPALPKYFGQGVAEPAGDVHPRPEILETRTIAGVGAGQGLALRDGMVYIYGDAETGIIRECRVVRTVGETPRLEPTGRDIALTRDGEDIAPHPTGLAFLDDGTALLGNTVNRVGTILHIDWSRALADRTLDNAVRRIIRDDAAVNGTRPEAVRLPPPGGGRALDTYIATSDYGDVDNAVRIMDPGRLVNSQRTGTPGVVVASWACGPFVQSLHWLERDNGRMLVLVQNISAGLGYRLTFIRMANPKDKWDLSEHPSIDLAWPTDELEGFAMLGDEYFAMVSASRENNVHIGRLRWVEHE